MQLLDYDISQQYSAIVQQSKRITPQDTEEVREIVIKIQDPSFAFKVGQCIGVIVPGPHDMGHKHHFRLYTIADIPKSRGLHQIELCVKRITYIDEYSGESYPGIASNFLCDLQQGASIEITGPYELPFQIPTDKSANLLMIGMGTGIAPFRAFVKHIYQQVGNWQGKVRLFYGARTGLESLYMNDQQNDFVQYYDEETFQAFNAISPRAHWGDAIDLDKILVEQKDEVWDMLQQTNTYVFIAGQEKIKIALENAFSQMAGSRAAWGERMQQLNETKRWGELIY